jgi:hypothetical protein
MALSARVSSAWVPALPRAWRLLWWSLLVLTMLAPDFDRVSLRSLRCDVLACQIGMRVLGYPRARESQRDAGALFSATLSVLCIPREKPMSLWTFAIGASGIALLVALWVVFATGDADRHL